MNAFKKLAYLFMLSLTFMACHDDDNKQTKEKKLTLRVNQFIHDDMSMFYLWNKEMPKIDPQKETDPIAYFKKLLKPDDKASIITDDAQGLIDQLNNTGETFGYGKIFYKISDTKFIAIVQYVYPGSPAEGKLQRGDIILKINNQYITQDNADLLSEKGTINLTKGRIMADNQLHENGKVTLSSQKMDSDPVLIHKVIQKGEHKIGYLMYTSFVSKFNHSLRNAFNSLKDQEITDLVLDLRYNHGGDDDAAQLMCSAIAPKDKAIDGELLSLEKWNSDCQKVFENDPQFDEQIHRYFKTVDCNLDLPKKRVYILTTQETISAAEYTAICLEPFMEVILIGSKTYGKYTTMIAMQPAKEDENGKIVVDEELSNWLIVPIVSKYTNINGYPNFSGGLEPKYTVEDQFIPTAYPLGSEDEPLLAKAIALITGKKQVNLKETSQTATPFKRIDKVLNDINSNRIIINNIK